MAVDVFLEAAVNLGVAGLALAIVWRITDKALGAITTAVGENTKATQRLEVAVARLDESVTDLKDVVQVRR